MHDARESNDVVLKEILQKAFRTDVRPVVNEMRRLGGGAIDPIMTYRKLQVRQQLVQKEEALLELLVYEKCQRHI